MSYRNSRDSNHWFRAIVAIAWLLGSPNSHAEYFELPAPVGLWFQVDAIGNGTAQASILAPESNQHLNRAERRSARFLVAQSCLLSFAVRGTGQGEKLVGFNAVLRCAAGSVPVQAQILNEQGGAEFQRIAPGTRGIVRIVEGVTIPER